MKKKAKKEAQLWVSVLMSYVFASGCVVLAFRLVVLRC